MRKSAFGVLASVFPFLAMGELGTATDHITFYKERSFKNLPPDKGTSPKQFGMRC